MFEPLPLHSSFLRSAIYYVTGAPLAGRLRTPEPLRREWDTREEQTILIFFEGPTEAGDTDCRGDTDCSV